MANIVIVTTANTIQVDFGDYSSSVGYSKGTWLKRMVEHIELEDSSSFVIVLTQKDPRWTLTFNGATGFQVDTIDGVAPTSNADLYTKLVAMLG